MATTTIATNGGVLVEPDTAITVGHTREAETTTHPVEDGSAIADNIVRKPPTVSLRCIFSPHPLSGEDLSPRGTDRPQRAFDALALAMQQRETVTVLSDGLFYGPAVITRLSMQRAFEDGSSRTFDLDLTEVLQVATKTAKLIPATTIKHGTGRRKTTVAPTKAQVATKAAMAFAGGNWVAAAALSTGLF